MRSSALVTLLCNAGLKEAGYTFEQHSLADHEAMVQRLSAMIGAVITNNAVVTMIEDEAAHAIYLATLPGHFAHPSIAVRVLVARDGARTVQVRGFTAGEPAIMSAWLGQFRAQDELVRQSYGR
jgi:type IV secretory pathway VirB4 component